MAEFTHLVAATTSPAAGWLTIFSSTSKWSQTELTTGQWTVQGNASSGFEGWTVRAIAATTFTAGAGAFPTGAISGFDVRDANGTLVVTVRGLTSLAFGAIELQNGPSRMFGGNDLFSGSSGADIFWAGGGSDTLNGAGGDDVLYIKSGVVDGGAGTDTIGTAGTITSAEPGFNATNVEVVNGQYISAATSTVGLTITGTDSADLIVGGAGADSISTGRGADTIFAGLGNDTIDAGNPYSGNVVDSSKDLLDFSRATSAVTVDLSLTTAQNTGAGVKTLLNFEQLRGSDFNDTLSGSSIIRTVADSTGVIDLPGGAVTLYGGLGNDSVSAGIGDDLLHGDEGADTLDGGAGTDMLRGGAGDDVLVGRGGETLDGGEGFDIVDYSLRGGGLNITLGTLTQTTGDSFVSVEGVIGSTFADTLSSSAAAGGGTYLAGGAGDDLLTGAQFAEVLRGGSGNDTMTGGAGGDKFVLALDGSADVINDFSAAQGDSLQILDGNGVAVTGTGGLLILNTTTRQLYWDADSDGGSAPVLLATMHGTSLLDARSVLASGFQASIRAVANNGSKAEFVFDWGSQSFDYTRTGFTAAGVVETYDIYYDNGSHGTRAWDVLGNQSWDSRAAEYDAQGRMTAYAVYNDDGSKQVFQYDVGGTKTWERLVESYDALGRLMVQAFKNDDGTASERTIDTYDTNPWAYYIDNYDALGRLLNHTFYNADRSVFG